MMQASSENISAEHLTGVLLSSGALKSGRVSEVDVVSTRDTILSRVTRIRLSYEDDYGNPPASLILKTVNPARAERGWNAGRHEVTFYTDVASHMKSRLVPYCFEGRHDPEQKSWHLLLEDLTDSHYIVPPVLPPTLEQCRSIVRARASFHAEWWDDPRLGTTVGKWLDATAENSFLERLVTAVNRFVGQLEDRLSTERRELYQRLLAAAPRLFERHRSHRNLTVVQADAHVWNCFLPKTTSSDDVRIFDWDSWRIDTGTDDLAYMMGLHWYPDQRRSFERPLLDLYLETLMTNGVNYSREALDADYRLSTLWHITTPVWQAAYDIPVGIWWTNLQRIFMAVDDLDCRELMD